MQRCEAWPDCACGTQDRYYSALSELSVFQKQRHSERTENARAGNAMTSRDLRLAYNAATRRVSYWRRKWVRLFNPPSSLEVRAFLLRKRLAVVKRMLKGAK